MAAFVVSFLLILVAWVVWGPLGSLVVEPLVRQYGATVVPSLRVAGVGGSLWSGITLNGIDLVSGDVSLLSADRIMIRPSWEQLVHGALWLSDLEIDGVHTDVKNIETLAGHYGGGEPSSSPLALKPMRVTLKDITLDTPLHSIRIDEGHLAQDGAVRLAVDMGGIPVLADGRLRFSPLEALSFDVAVGSGRIHLDGRLMAPFDVKGNFRDLQLDELLSTVSKIEGRGVFDGTFNVQGAGEALKAWGKVYLDGGEIAGIPVEASVPWRYRDSNFIVSDAKISSLSADIDLKVSADLRPVPLHDRLLVRGSVKNISMKKLQKALSPQTFVEGEGGMLDFFTSMDQKGQVAGRVFVRLPELKVSGKQIVKGLRADLVMASDRRLKADCSGEIFGGKLTGKGEARPGEALRSSMLFTVEGLNSALVAAAFPALAPLSPSGTLSLTAKVDERLAVEGEVRSSALTLSGVRLDALLASVRYDDNRVVLEGLSGRIGKAPLDLSGTADLKTSALRFSGSLKGFDPASVPALNGQIRGVCDMSLTVQGTTRSPEVTVALAGENNSVADIPVRRLRLSGSYANDRVTIPETLLLVPGGSLAFRGEVGLPKGREPDLNLSGNLTNLDLGTFSRPWGTNVSGRLEGSLKILGPLSNASLTALVRSDRITMTSTDIRGLYLDVSGTTRDVEVRSVRAKIGNGSVDGKGRVTFDRRGKMQVDMKVEDIEIRSLLAQFGVDAGIGGNLDGSLLLSGTPVRPELTLKVTSPLTVKETLVDRLTVTVISPARGKFDLNSSGKLGDLLLNLKAHVERGREGWSYLAESDWLDMDQLIAAKMPSMKGRFEGKIKARVSGRTDRGGKPQPVDVLISLPSFSTAGIQVKDISLPVRVLGNSATIRNGSGVAYDGKIAISADVFMPEQRWKAVTKITGLNIGKAAAPFMKEGEIVGSADVNVNLNGNYGALMMTFANGDFNSSSGHIHKFKVLDKIAENGRISFEKIRGSFFWDGKDLWLNPGTQATAQPGDPLYRYFAINGSMGIPGKGLALNCYGRFDVHLLDTVLGALRGAFQLMTGTLTGGGQLIRQAMGKVVGLTERDFQDVSFQLKGNWKELQLLNLKIDKSLEGYLPLQNLNEKSEENKEAERKIQFNLKIPTGRGGNGDGQDTQDQFKKQLLDNLLNQLDY